MTSGKKITPQSPVEALPGFGPKRAKLIARLGIERVGDFMTYFPRGYEDRSRIYPLAEAPEGVKSCFSLIVGSDPTLARLPRGMEVVKVKAFDDTRSIEIIFFNRPYIKNQIKKGREYIFYGKAEYYGGRLSMVNPLFEEAGKTGGVTGRIVPIYPLSAGVTSAMVEQGVRAALDCCPLPESPIPYEIEERAGLMPAAEAYRQIHLPDSAEKAARAAKRFAFEELYVFCCASVGMKNKVRSNIAHPMGYYTPEKFYPSLPFTPTNAQKRVIDEVFLDMTSSSRMNRLVQGDVGSGKTLVAAACAWLCYINCRQTVIMAPTELLARQHYKTMTELLRPYGVKVGLLVSNMSAPEKRNALEKAADGRFDLICGTHALIQSGVKFRNPALFVIDEQHRFGVGQRAELARKQPDSHMLVMSATPIPRTLSLIIFGDLDLSVIDELPAGRRPVETYCVGEDKRARMEAFLQKQVAAGGQAYIVCPLIEEGEDESRASAEKYARELSRRLPGLRIGLMHGRLSSSEKEDVMVRFAAGELDVLVSTTVIEVGIDVPNANMMIIENCELFGLSQLHQLRGRVGRGDRQSYCILMRKGPRLPRLEVICHTNDGFKVAEEDLRLRGPGDFFGQRQHGLPAFKLADLSTDMRIFEAAKRAAEATFAKSPGLVGDEYTELRRRIAVIIEQNERLN